jgi:TonB family protein
MQGLFLRKVAPVYPPLARQARIQGTVMLNAVIGKDGAILDLKLVSGHPMLAPAAMEAVRQWRYKPYLLEGTAVEVETNIQVNFALREDPPAQLPLDSDGKPSPDLGPAPSSAGGEAPQRVRVSQGVSTGLLVYRVQPVYPEKARRAYIQGTVLLQAVISKEGRIVDLKLISGPKELAPSAIGAVQQWRYRPYMLMGKPVEVETTVQVNFQLSLR